MFLRGTPLSITKSNSSHYATTSIRTTGRSSLSIVCGESRIGKLPVPIPAGVEYKLAGQHLVVKVSLSFYLNRKAIGFVALGSTR